MVRNPISPKYKALFSPKYCLWAGSSFNRHTVCLPSDCLMLGTEVNLQKVDNSVFAMETVLKVWLQEQGGDREQLHLLLPSPVDNPIPGAGCTFNPGNTMFFIVAVQPIMLEVMIFVFCAVCLKCDMQERMISPALIPFNPTLGLKTESVSGFLPVPNGTANQIQAPQRLRAIK